jgi:uncharacterized protein with beta-barrel porin domain
MTFLNGISNSGTISADALGIYLAGVSNFSGNVSNSGTIVGQTGIVIGAGVTFAAGSAIVNSGAITGTGGKAIDLSAATSPVTVDINGGTVAGNMLGAGLASGDTLNFALGGGKTFTYGSNFENFDTVNVNSGTVVLNGTSNSAATVNVNSGGTLAGTGSIDPAMTIFSGGILAPGTPGIAGGTLNITGSVTFESGSYYQIAINPTQNSLGAVNGAVTINGGTVVLVPPATLGTHYAARTDVTILTSTTLTGAFSPTAIYGGSVKLSNTATVFDVGNNVDISYAASIGLLSPPSNATINEQNVANGINAAILNGDSLPPAIANLGTLSGPALLTTLSQLDGQSATGAQTGTFQLMNDFFNLLSDMTFGGGGGGAGVGGTAAGFAPEEHDGLPADVALAYDQALGKAPAAQSFAQRWNAWGSAYGGSANYNGNAAIGSNNVNASDYGFAGGLDYYATPDLKVGFALAGAGTNWHLSQNLGSGRSDVFQAAGYAVKHFGPAYISGMAAFGNSWFTTNRTAALGDQLRAKFEGQSYGLRAETGYRFAVLPTVGITPYGAVQTQWFRTPSYSETDLNGGGFALSYNAQNANDTRSELGARADDLTMLGTMPMVLRARVAWAHDWVSNPTLGAVFQTLPGAAFTVNGAAIPANSALASAGAQVFFTPNWSVEAKFNGEFASTAQTYAGTGTLKYSW